MQKFLKAIEPFKKAIVLLIVLFIGYITVGKVVPAISTASRWYIKYQNWSQSYRQHMEVSYIRNR